MARRYDAGNYIYKAIRKSQEDLVSIKRNNLPSFLLICVYAVGITFILTDWIPGFIMLTPFNLIFSVGMILWQHPKWDGKIIFMLALAFLTGFFVEMAGVATGVIFGEYSYGEVLGPKWHGTPWTMGLNWLMLIYCGGTVSIKLLPQGNWLLRTLTASLMLVSLDILIEPVAIYYGFWSWGVDNIIPIQNYIAWFVISFFLFGIFNLLFKELKNNAAFTLFILQFVFFFLLGIQW